MAPSLETSSSGKMDLVSFSLADFRTSASSLAFLVGRFHLGGELGGARDGRVGRLVALADATTREAQHPADDRGDDG